MTKRVIVVLCCLFTAFVFSCNKKDSNNQNVGFTKTAKATDMSIGDMHNQICADMIAMYAYQEQVNWDDVFNSIVKDAATYGLEVSKDLTFTAVKSKYLAGVTGWRDLYTNMAKAGDISANVCKYLTVFCSKIEGEGKINSDVIQSDISATKMLPEYRMLSEAERAQVDLYHDGFAKSFSFWSVQDQSNPLAKKGNPCSCGVKCLICVAAFDAGGLCIPTVGLATGPVFSLVARCCICGCCGNVNCS